MSETPPAPADQPTADAHSGPTNPDVRYERTDADARSIVIFSLSLAGVLIVIHLLLHWMFDVLDRREQRDDPGRPAVAAKRPTFPKQIDDIPRPVLQRVEEYDLAKLRHSEDERLNNWDPRAKLPLPVLAAGIVCLLGSPSGQGPLLITSSLFPANIPVAEAIRRLEANPQTAVSNGIRFREAPKKEPNGGKK
jgi:hypothetical protein